MDQRQTTEGALYESLFPPKDFAYWLGKALNYPVSDIPTREDLEREQGLIGVPTDDQRERESGQEILDWLTRTATLAGILKAPTRRPGDTFPHEWPTPMEVDLMGKQRGAETFGKEMMETSRRAQPRRWREMEHENWNRERNLPGMEGRTYDPVRHGMPPESPMGRREIGAITGQERPADIVRPGMQEYRIGTPTALPGGATASYRIWSDVAGQFRVTLDYLGKGEDMARRFDAGTFNTIGEATAKARQLANRLDLAAKDLAAKGLHDVHDDWRALGVVPESRDVRLPWEPGRRAPHLKNQEPGRTYPTFPGRWRTDYPFGPGGPTQ